MLSIDTNLLIYAVQPESPSQPEAAKFLEEEVNQKGVLVICKLVLVELYMQLRNPWIFSKPQTPAAAAAYCQTLRSTPGMRHIDNNPASL